MRLGMPTIAARLCLPLGAALAVLPAGAQAPEPVVAYRIVDARTIPDSLTGRPGDADRGRILYFDQQLARCSGCHGLPSGPAPRAGAAGPAAPSLSGIARRMEAGAIRLWLVAPDVASPGTGMPSYYAVGQRDDPADPRFGEPLLSAEQVEDLVAFLVRQTGQR